MPPFNFSDEELDALLAAAAPLPWQLRDAFIHDVAQTLQGLTLGPGLLHRKIVEVQRRYLDAIEGHPRAGAGKYR